jgi:flagellar hook-basal body complex protein FliE
MTSPIRGFQPNSVASVGLDTGAKPVPVLQDSGTTGTSFGDTLKRVLNNVSDQQDVANDYIARFTRGEPVELHQVMAAAEEASISLEMLVELRNKFLDAYRTVISMQS